jgi:ribosomal subunit interface protein
MIISEKMRSTLFAKNTMNVHFHAKHLCLSDSVKNYAIGHLACSLGRSQHKVVRIDIYFSQEESSKDTACKVRLRQNGQEEISAQEVQADIYQATERAITRATRSLERQTMIQDFFPGVSR